MAQRSATARVVHYDGPAGGWGSLRGITRIFGEEWPTPAAIETLARQNKPDGYMCVSCSWAKPADIRGRLNSARTAPKQRPGKSQAKRRRRNSSRSIR